MPFCNSQNFTGSKRYWTRERVLEALKAAGKTITGRLPCLDDEYNRIKKGNLDWPTSFRVLFYFHSMGRAWLAAGFPKKRVSLHNISWSSEEDSYLLDHAGEKTLKDIAKYLCRSYGAARRRLNEYGVRARDNQGYLSAAQLAREFNSPYHRVRDALAAGDIKGFFDKVRNRWQVDIGSLTPRAEEILKAPKRTYKTFPTDIGNYYERMGLKRIKLRGKTKVVDKK